MIRIELAEPVDSETLWTDSTAVLKYIRNETNVQTIRDETRPNQWSYDDGRANPADDAARGLKGCELSTQQCWIRGPHFLWLPESEWP